MAIKIAINNPNANADSVKVYRSTSRIDIGNLPDPLATLPGSATGFSDATAVRNKVYFYVIAIAKGSDVLFTQNQEYGYFPDTGPGPTKLLRGSWTSGYFGTCSAAELAQNSELATAMGINLNAVNTSQVQIWHKFIVDGKILFQPQYTVGQTTWINLYNNGLVYGTNDNGARPATGSVSTLNPVNQMKTFTKDNRKYIVRLPKASAAPTTELLGDFTAADARWADGEWNRTMGRLGYNAFTLCTRKRLGNVLSQYTSNNYMYTPTYTQHVHNTSGNVIYMNNTATDVPFAQAYNGTYYSWRPVLELVL